MDVLLQDNSVDAVQSRRHHHWPSREKWSETIATLNTDTPYSTGQMEAKVQFQMNLAAFENLVKSIRVNFNFVTFVDFPYFLRILSFSSA